jgi:hypothetical protein
MNLRNATFEDKDSLMELAHKAHENSIFADFKMSEAEMQRTFVVLVASEEGYAKVIERDGDVIGGLIGAISMNQFGVRCAQDLLTFSYGGTQLLIKDFYKWAKAQGADFVQMTDLGGIKRYDKLISALAFEPSGRYYMRT